MRLQILFLCFFIFGISPVFAALNLEVNIIDKGSIVISELDNPAIFDFIITNNGESDSAEIFSLIGMNMWPKGTFELPGGGAKTTIEVRAFPPEEIRKRDGTYSLEYQLKGSQGLFRDKLTIKVVYLENVLKVNAENIHPDDEDAVIIVKNGFNTHLENLDMRFKSIFFDFNENISLGKFEEVKISTKIDKSKTSRLIAGPYVVIAKAEVEGVEAEFEGVVNYLEKEGISVDRTSKGFLIRENIITKTNEGNLPVIANIEMKKDIVSRLFSTFSAEPLSSERTVFVVRYVWEQELGPGESFSIVSRTNYTVPFILVVLIVLIVLLVRFYTMTALTINKKVYLVKTKGGEFALRVRVSIKAKKEVKNIEISDRLPEMTKLYEKYGRNPNRVDEKSRRLFWNIQYLNAGEERTFSYVVYSKLRAVGRFELPVARAVFEHNGEKKDIHSNRAYFVSETVGED